MSKRHIHLLIEDILDSADKILSYTLNLSFEEFTRDGMVVDAVIRNFEIIGEAANRLPDEFKDTHMNIDWHGSKVSEIALFTVISGSIMQLCGQSYKSSYQA